MDSKEKGAVEIIPMDQIHPRRRPILHLAKCITVNIHSKMIGVIDPVIPFTKGIVKFISMTLLISPLQGCHSRYPFVLNK